MNEFNDKEPTKQIYPGRTAILGTIGKTNAAASANRSDAPRADVSYYVVQDETGEIVHEGRVESMTKLYGLTTKEFRECEKDGCHLPNGYTFQKHHSSGRKMRKRVNYYTVYEHGEIVFQGYGNDVTRELGISSGKLSQYCKEERIYHKVYSFTMEKVFK